MTISYNWLHEYLPGGKAGLPNSIDPEKLSSILSSIGLEVESLEKYEEVKGGMEGLVIGEVIACEKHPNADKLSLTKVNIGAGEPLQIVCGAPNVATGQKVVVAAVGTTIYPKKAEPLTMKVAKIRGAESHGMICAEDEIGLSEDHAGIMVLPDAVKAGTPAADYFKPYTDWIYEIGLTPNRSDAMSHLGVARDVCAWLSHHENKKVKVKSPFPDQFKADNNKLPISVTIENTGACRRYAGVSISNVTVKESPRWLQQKLKAIGLRPISNIVDITNYILHETGQPLHAFDADAIKGGKIVVKNLPEGTPFVTLDGKERKLSAEDLMICNAEDGMCIGGVYGGVNSGVQNNTRNIFLESAWFNPVNIRKTSFRYNLRTDAAIRFEKSVDIGNAVNVLKRAALMIKEMAGGEIASEVVDVYPAPAEKKEVTLSFSYLKRLSGKVYAPDTVKNILESLGFEILFQNDAEIKAAVPLHKTDVSLPADIVEEVMRIDGFDNVEIPRSITITPSVEISDHPASYQEKTSGLLAGMGFHEIFSNSITNSAFYTEEEIKTGVRMMNSLSAELNMMRPEMLESGLQSIIHNLNRKNNNLRFFEFGKTYTAGKAGKYDEDNHLVLYVSGNITEEGWKIKKQTADFHYLKGIIHSLISQCGIEAEEYMVADHPKLSPYVQVNYNGTKIAVVGGVNKKLLDRFDIRQDVWYADVLWDELMRITAGLEIRYRDIPRFPAVNRDLAFVIDKKLAYGTVESVARSAKIERLVSVELFDVFESEKLGKEKKSMAVSFTFQDEEKTLTDKEIDDMMKKIITVFEKELRAEIRK
ncbi:MAG: phenylalanine--tRNA ligase subunit beta [Chitinophagaceae bacterium]|nr:phenylalanine--tRNA ligase subunit beta [Chitinophagaceae bacterium]